jgi:hypothetical protein
MTIQKVYNPLTNLINIGDYMPRFITRQWNDYQIRLTPNDTTRNLIREIIGRRDFIPYFYGEIAFDLAVAIPRNKIKKLVNTEIEYEWQFVQSKDDSLIKSSKGTMILASKKVFDYRKAKAGDTTHYGYYGFAWFKYKTFRKVQAIDLGYLSKLDQYKIVMRAFNKTETLIDNKVMLEFTLQDLDIHTMNVIYLVIGAGIGIIAGIIGYVFGIH